jgi:hypothetical protein
VRGNYINTVYESDQPDDSENNITNLSCSHPQFNERQNRLDLISNNIMDVNVKVGGTSCHLCDVSMSGFSYAKEISLKRKLSFQQLKTVLDQSVTKSHGQQIKSIFAMKETTDSKSFEIMSTIRNHRLFLGLNKEEVERELNNFLYKKTIRRNNDTNHIYDKIDHLFKMVQESTDATHWNESLMVSLNTTLLNFMKEVGATSEDIDELYQKYTDKNTFVRFGTSVDEPKQAKKLFNFLLGPEYDVKELSKTEIINNLNKKYSFKKFLFKVFRQCLFQLSMDANLEFPKSYNKKLAEHLKKEATVFNGHLELLGDDELKSGNSQASELFLVEGLLKLLDKKQQKTIDKIYLFELVVKSIKECYILCQFEVIEDSKPIK